MSHKVWLDAYRVEWPDRVEYTEDWLNENLHDEEPEGRLVLGYGGAFHSIHRGIKSAPAEIIITGDGDIFARAKKLRQILFHAWGTWHKNDDRWHWRWETIEDFFERYGEYNYVFVIIVY